MAKLHPQRTVQPGQRNGSSALRTAAVQQRNTMATLHSQRTVQPSQRTGSSALRSGTAVKQHGHTAHPSAVHIAQLTAA
jgi:hypothetical protein